VSQIVHLVVHMPHTAAVASFQELISAISANDGNFSSTSAGQEGSIITWPPVDEGDNGVNLGPVGVLKYLGNE
jgi:hypothetical protein